MVMNTKIALSEMRGRMYQAQTDQLMMNNAKQHLSNQRHNNEIWQYQNALENERKNLASTINQYNQLIKEYNQLVEKSNSSIDENQKLKESNERLRNIRQESIERYLALEKEKMELLAEAAGLKAVIRMLLAKLRELNPSDPLLDKKNRDAIFNENFNSEAEKQNKYRSPDDQILKR